MDIVTRACWYATWCQACRFNVARRRWVEDVLLLAFDSCRASDLAQRTIGEAPHVAGLSC